VALPLARAGMPAPFMLVQVAHGFEARGQSLAGSLRGVRNSLGARAPTLNALGQSTCRLMIE
jgi:hypothetical protein